MSPNLKTIVPTLDLDANHRVGRQMSRHMWSNRSPRCPFGPSFCSDPPNSLSHVISFTRHILEIIFTVNDCDGCNGGSGLEFRWVWMSVWWWLFWLTIDMSPLWLICLGLIHFPRNVLCLKVPSPVKCEACRPASVHSHNTHSAPMNAFFIVCLFLNLLWLQSVNTQVTLSVSPYFSPMYL